jgi:hypothetical protein
MATTPIPPPWYSSINQDPHLLETVRVVYNRAFGFHHDQTEAISAVVRAVEQHVHHQYETAISSVREQVRDAGRS